MKPNAIITDGGGSNILDSRLSLRVLIAECGRQKVVVGIRL